MLTTCRDVARNVSTVLLVAGSAWAAVAPRGPLTDFDDLGLAQAGQRAAGGGEKLFPPGRRSEFDPATGARVDPAAMHRGQPACFMHGPYLGGVGRTFQEFTLQLPAAPAGVLKGQTALADGAEKSDGVTFRVLVNGTAAWSAHRNGPEWQPFVVDLATWTGQVVRIRFEVDPGPAGSSAFDWALWGTRRLLLPGYAGPPRPPDPPALAMAPLHAQQNGSWVPLSGFATRHTVQVDGRTAALTSRGADGELAYTWSLAEDTAPAALGIFHLRATMAGGPPVELVPADGGRIEWDRDVRIVSTTLRRRGDAAEAVRELAAGTARARLTLRARLEQKSLVLEAECDQPWIKSFAAGDWGPVAFRRAVRVPYCGHTPDYLPAENLFVNRFPDWTASGAAHFNGLRAIYEPLTDGTRGALRERFIFSPAWHLVEVLPNIPNPPSPWRDYMGGRLVLDIWDGGPFERIAEGLDTLARAGVRDGLILLHVWQRDGYDNGLPAHWPPREQQGGEAGMRRLAETARRLGHRLALHENYVDYYPNYEHFTTNDISLNATGGLVKAWLNEGTGIQSFAVKPSAILRLSREQSPEIHRRYDTTASYLDVHSCVPPWFHVDQRAGEPGAGRLRAVWDTHRALWAYHRQVHEGPAIGEGNNHWLWSGWLDGVEAQFGTGWPWAEGLNAPLLADFNLLRIHPLQINHGQGYLDRWHGKEPPWGSGLPMVALDQYRQQEIVFGHAGFLANSLWRQPAAAWLEHHLVGPVTRRQAGDRVAEIRYFVDGRWVDTTAAAKAGRFDRVRIRYARGLSITANGAADDWTVDGQVLPPHGWIATNRDFFAGTVRRAGVVVDLVDAPDFRMAHARRARDWCFLGGVSPVTVAVSDFQTLEDRKVRFSYRWTSGANLTRDLRAFVHFDVPQDGYTPWKTVAQQDHTLRPPTTTWTSGTERVDGPYDFTLPAGLADGRYTWFVGLWDDHGRLAIEGHDDGQSRIRVGELVVAEGGRAIRFQPAEPAPARNEWFRRHLNVEEKPVDFGFTRTATGVAQRRVNGEWKDAGIYPAQP